VKELHHKIESANDDDQKKAGKAGFALIIFQIALIDIVFSLDSVITAVGMVEDVWVMVTAMVIAMVVMLFFAAPISRFVDKNPAIKVLALSFLILIGVLLLAEALGQHLDKGYIYFAMAFAVVIELVNMRLR
jgi:predicted tellurium resistance membrane protein TerC